MLQSCGYQSIQHLNPYVPARYGLLIFSMISPLLLLGIRLLSLSLSPLLPHTLQFRLAPCIPQFAVRSLLALGHLTALDLCQPKLSSRTRLDRQHALSMLDMAVLDLLDLLGAAVALLVLARLAREQDQAAAIGLESCDVELQRFFGGVLATGINRNADCGCEFAGNAGFLQFLQREAAASPKAAVVFEGWASDDWSELVDWARCDCGSLRETSCTTARFAAWLVKMHTDAALPVLVEVGVRDLLVVLLRRGGSVSLCLLFRG